MFKKYELTSETRVTYGKTLYRIRALVAFWDVKAGELGGWVEKETNLSQSGNAWVYDNAQVYGDAEVCCDARVYGEAKVYGDAKVCDGALIYGNAQVYGDAEVCCDARVGGNAKVCGNAEIKLNTHLFQLGAIGSRNDFTTFFRTKDKRLFVSCGCFCGSVDEFEKRVRQTHGNNKHAKAYALAIELAKLQVEDVEVQ